MWPDAAETRKLLEQIEQADPCAADELWERHRPALRRMIGARLDQALGRRVDASDIVQDVLLRASQRLGDYLRSPSLPFHLWLRQIARDRMVDAHRRHRGVEKRSLNRERSLGAHLEGNSCADRSSFELAAQIEDDALTPAAEAIRDELRRRFQDAMNALDDMDREIIMIRHFEQLSNSEAARVMNLSEAAAGMRHLRALRRLRQVLGGAVSPC